MSKFTLLTSQRNAIFRLIQENKFSHSEFEWVETGCTASAYSSVPELRHIPTEFYFTFDRIEDSEGDTEFLVHNSPGQELQYESDPAGEWSNVLARLSRWLGYVQRETGEPDLWDSATDAGQLVQDAAEQPSDNLPFTEAELLHIQKALGEIKVYVRKTHELSEAQNTIIDARFEYMEKAATRMGRKDWLNIVISNLVSIVMALYLNAESSRDLFRFARQMFKDILGGMLYLVGPH